jgi:phage protein U
MTPWLSLGDMVFELPEGPEELSLASAQEWAEHASIGGKPRLQWVGEKLREVRFRLVLRWQLGDPEERLRELLAAAAAHQPLALVLGSGEYGQPWAGQYVLTETPSTLRQQADNGRPLIIEVDVALREWVPDALVAVKASKGKAIKTARKSAVATKTGPATVAFEPYTAGGYTVSVPKTVTRQPAPTVPSAPKLPKR